MSESFVTLPSGDKAYRIPKTKESRQLSMDAMQFLIDNPDVAWKISKGEITYLEDYMCKCREAGESCLIHP